MYDHDEVEALRREVRRLKAQVFALEEEKADLHRRYAYVCQELERTRAMVQPSSLRTATCHRQQDVNEKSQRTSR